MKASINYLGKNYEINLERALNISLPLTNTDNNPLAWYLNKPEISPVIIDEWVGKVSEGNSSTNFNNIAFNPHAHGTHTECLGHITHNFYSVNDSLQSYFFLAQLITLSPQVQANGDCVIILPAIEAVWEEGNQNAVVIRTLPNEPSKICRKYSNTNPPYLDKAAALFLREKGIKHLLIDLPSVDKEQDGGELSAHKAFWNVTDTKCLNKDARLEATITEMIYVSNDIVDGMYFLNLQLAPFVNDASPSQPILYKIE